MKKPFISFFTWRPFKFRSILVYELISFVLMFASVPMLAYGIKVYNLDVIKTIVLTILTLYSGYFAALIWNDLTDADIDAVAHPDRPLPSGKISKKKFFAVALVFSAMTFIFASLVSICCLVLVGATALFVAFHNKYLKKIIKIPAYSEIFTPIQWIIVPIFGFIAIWTTYQPNRNLIGTIPIFEHFSIYNPGFQTMILLALFTYFADDAHDIAEGIHDAEGDRRFGVKTYSTSFGEKNAAKISFLMFLISGILGLLLFLKTILSAVFFVPFFLIWLYTLYGSHNLMNGDKEYMKKKGESIGKKGFDYLLIFYNLIFVDLLLQLIFYNSSFFN